MRDPALGRIAGRQPARRETPRQASQVGVLVSNLGTPEAPTTAALRRYLREFLSDPRVVELPRWRWLPILYCFVLTLRPPRVARQYRKIWTQHGSPLLVTARRQARGLEQRLEERTGRVLPVELGMRYGRPSIAYALDRLQARGCRRILVLPLYPQYSAATTGSTFDAVARKILEWRAVPELRTVSDYHRHRPYLEALARSLEERWSERGLPERLVCSYHGLPQRYADAGDPYPEQCQATTALLAERLALDPASILTTFQSKFGREPWLLPATDQALEVLAQGGTRSVDVLCPGFSADCLETLEEIDMLNRSIFLQSGGERFGFVRSLNDRPDHLAGLADLVLAKTGDWLVEEAGTDASSELGPRERWAER